MFGLSRRIREHVNWQGVNFLSRIIIFKGGGLSCHCAEEVVVIYVEIELKRHI